MAEDTKPVPMDDQAEFVLSFVDDARQDRAPFEEIWEESEENWLVRSHGDIGWANRTDYPLTKSVRDFRGPRRSGYSRLKDPETHQSVMTIAAKLVLGAMGESGFIKAKRVGWEDLFASTVVSKLLEYNLRKEGAFWSFVEWVVGTAVYGTGILETAWDTIEEPRNFRRIDVNPLTGQEISTSETLVVPVWDDVRYSCVHIRDFFHDPGQTQLPRMQGAAKRFRITKQVADFRAERGLYDTAKVNKAKQFGQKRSQQEDEDHRGEETAGTHVKESHPDYKQLVGFEFYGNVPWPAPDGIQRRVVTVLNGVTVRSKPWPRRIPFTDLRITPRLGSFFGIGVAEVIRHDQDFADTLKMMLADAVVRMTHPPNIYNRFAGQDVANKLRRFVPDIPIGVDGDPNAAIGQVPYAPPVQPAFQMYAGVKQQMREGGGALGAIQGIGLGSKRFSATEAAGTFEQAMDRPELWAAILEREALPSVGRTTLELDQEFLEEGTDDLQRRVGESEYPVVLANILGDFDLEFMGSRISGSRNEQLAAFREIAQASANPIISQVTPWIPLLRKWFDQLGAPEIASMVGNEQLTQLNVMLTQLGQQGLGGNGNGETPSQNPVGQLPAQAQGSLIA